MIRLKIVLTKSKRESMLEQAQNISDRKARIIHGCGKRGKRSKEYSAWANIKQRCYNKNVRLYKNYGGRGIVMCDRWKSFVNFLNDMGLAPSPKHSIDRIDNDGNYEPSNCKWSTFIEQQRNKTDSRLLEYQGKFQTAGKWAEDTGIKEAAINSRLVRGWSVEEALTIPARIISKTNDAKNSFNDKNFML